MHSPVVCWLLAWRLIPLMLAVSADLYLSAALVTGRPVLSPIFTLLLLVVFMAFWYLLP